MRIILTLLVLVMFSQLSAQSLSGNLRSNASEMNLSYGNVDIYDGDELVASVLTDELGNFNVALDSGSYTCVINYAGHLPIRKEVHVKNDETSNFELDEDPTKPKLLLVESKAEDIAPMTDSYELAEVSIATKAPGRIRKMGKTKSRDTDAYRVSDAEGLEYTEAEFMGGMYDKKDRIRKKRSGSLTAGEVNDFSKWEMWKDLREDELKAYGKSWQIIPDGRYTLILQNKVGIPIADAKVDLVDKNTVLFSARTDNTGKAELWLTTKGGLLERANLDMLVDFKGKKERIRNVKPFKREINYHIMDIECQEMNNVDIAFVVDATGSMSDELAYLQAELNDVMFKSKKISKKLNFHFANVFYRDLGSNEEYCTRTMDFNRVLSESVQFINHQGAGGGGDYEEAVEIALDTAINHLSWNEDARCRVIFLILDAPPHNTGAQRTKMEKLLRDAAKKGIRIVPVGASGINKSTEYLMRTLALGTNGTYTFLTNHSGIGNAHIEPSTDSYKVETFNDLMTRILKSYTYMPDCEQNIPDLDLDYPDSLVVVQNDTIHRDTTIRDTINNQQQPPLTQIRWSYYPNPTQGVINIKADIDIDEIYLSDLTGKLLQSITNVKKDRVYQMDLSMYPTGIYLLRYLHEDRWVSGKVMLIH